MVAGRWHRSFYVTSNETAWIRILINGQQFYVAIRQETWWIYAKVTRLCDREQDSELVHIRMVYNEIFGIGFQARTGI